MNCLFKLQQESGQRDMPKELDSSSLFKEYEIQCFVPVQSFQVHTTVPKKIASFSCTDTETLFVKYCLDSVLIITNE